MPLFQQQKKISYLYVLIGYHPFTVVQEVSEQMCFRSKLSQHINKKKKKNKPCHVHNLECFTKHKKENKFKGETWQLSSGHLK